MTTLPPPSSGFRNDHELRSARHRARELGILPAFWECVCAGDWNGAMGRLALEEERVHRRRTRVTATLLGWSLISALLALTLHLW